MNANDIDVAVDPADELSMGVPLPKAASSRPKPMRFLLTRIIVFILGLAVVAAVVVYALLSAEPDHWKQNLHFRDITPRAQREALAESVQQRVFNALASLSDGRQQQVTIRVSVDEANAWLETRLPGWLTNQNIAMPDAIGDPMIAVSDDRLVTAFEYRSQQVNQIVSMTFDAKVVAPGQARLRLFNIRAGRLALPLQTLLDELRSRGGDDQRLNELTSVCEGEPFDANWTSQDGAVCQLVGLDLHDDAVDLTFAARRPPNATPSTTIKQP